MGLQNAVIETSQTGLHKPQVFPAVFYVLQICSNNHYTDIVPFACVANVIRICILGTKERCSDE